MWTYRNDVKVIPWALCWWVDVQAVCIWGRRVFLCWSCCFCRWYNSSGTLRHGYEIDASRPRFTFQRVFYVFSIMPINRNAFFLPRRYEACDKLRMLYNLIWAAFYKRRLFTERHDIEFTKNRFNNRFNSFRKLDPFLKCKLFDAYCSSNYRCVLWNLSNCSLPDISVAWMIALRRKLCNECSLWLELWRVRRTWSSLPVLSEFSRRSLNFLSTCTACSVLCYNEVFFRCAWTELCSVWLSV